MWHTHQHLSGETIIYSDDNRLAVVKVVDWMPPMPEWDGAAPMVTRESGEGWTVTDMTAGKTNDTSDVAEILEMTDLNPSYAKDQRILRRWAKVYHGVEHVFFGGDRETDIITYIPQDWIDEGAYPTPPTSEKLEEWATGQMGEYMAWAVGEVYCLDTYVRTTTETVRTYHHNNTVARGTEEEWRLWEGAGIIYGDDVECARSLVRDIWNNLED